MSKRKRRNRDMLGKALVAIDRGRAWYSIMPRREQALIGYSAWRKAIRRLREEGLLGIKRDRPGSTHRRTTTVVTEKGEEALWSGDLGLPKPEAKSAPRRREKRSRHV